MLWVDVINAGLSLLFMARELERQLQAIFKQVCI